MGDDAFKLGEFVWIILTTRSGCLDNDYPSGLANRLSWLHLNSCHKTLGLFTYPSISHPLPREVRQEVRASLLTGPELILKHRIRWWCYSNSARLYFNGMGHLYDSGTPLSIQYSYGLLFSFPVRKRGRSVRIPSEVFNVLCLTLWCLLASTRGIVGDRWSIDKHNSAETCPASQKVRTIYTIFIDLGLN